MSQALDPVTVVGHARVDRRTKNLVKRLVPGDIAVIDHEDVDRMAAEQLIERRVAVDPAELADASKPLNAMLKR